MPGEEKATAVNSPSWFTPVHRPRQMTRLFGLKSPKRFLGHCALRRPTPERPRNKQREGRASGPLLKMPGTLRCPPKPFICFFIHRPDETTLWPRDIRTRYVFLTISSCIANARLLSFFNSVLNPFQELSLGARSPKSRITRPSRTNRSCRKTKSRVSESQIADVLDIDVALIRKKRDLLVGICGEAVEPLKGKKATSATFAQLRKVVPIRQFEISERMCATNNFSDSYFKCLVAATSNEQLVDKETDRELDGLSAIDMALMEREMGYSDQRLQANR